MPSFPFSGEIGQAQGFRLYLTGADTVTAGVGGGLMAGVLTASRMLGWRGYKVGKLLKSWKAQAPNDVSATADVAG